MRARDAQRQKLYDAQSFPRSVALLPAFANVTEVAAWYETILRSAWAKREFPRLTTQKYGGGPFRPRVKVNGKIQRYAGWHRGGDIEFPHGSVDRWTALHELAHWLRHIEKRDYSQPLEAGHGREFAATLLTLVKHEFGADIAQQLRESYVKHGVRYRARKTLSPETLVKMRERGKQLAATHFNKGGV